MVFEEPVVLGRQERVDDELWHRLDRQIEAALLGIFAEQRPVRRMDARHHRRFIILELRIVRQILGVMPDQSRDGGGLVRVVIIAVAVYALFLKLGYTGTMFAFVVSHVIVALPLAALHQLVAAFQHGDHRLRVLERQPPGALAVQGIGDPPAVG